MCMLKYFEEPELLFYITSWKLVLKKFFSLARATQNCMQNSQ